MPSSVTINLPGHKCFSINQTSCRDMRFKSKAFKEWHLITKSAIEQLPEHKQLMEIAAAHNNQPLGVTIYVYYPKVFFFNAQGTISSKTIDCSNFEKNILDLLIGDIMGLNDKYVTELNSMKLPSEDGFGLTIILELLGHPYPKPPK